MVASAGAGTPSGGIAELFQKRNLKPLYVGLSVVLFQQITGQPSVLYYAEQVFEAAGYDSDQGAGVSVILGLFKLIMTGFAVKYVDTLGRRPLLLGGVSVMTLATAVLGACSATLAAGGAANAPLTANASVVAVFMYVGAYQVSFGPIAWLLVGEIFPQRVRSAAVGAATLTNFGKQLRRVSVPAHHHRHLRPGGDVLPLQLDGRRRAAVHLPHRRGNQGKDAGGDRGADDQVTRA